MGRAIDAAKQEAVENEKLHRDLRVQDIEIKHLLAHNEIDIEWKAICKERSIVNMQQKKRLENMEREIDAAKELITNHRILQSKHEQLQQSHGLLRQKHQSLQQNHTSLQQDHISLQQDHSNLREEKAKSDEKIHDLEARLDSTTREWLEAKLDQQHVSHSMLQKSPENARPRPRSNSAFENSIPKRTVDEILVHVSNRHDLPSAVIAYLQKEFFLTGVSLGRVNNPSFTQAAIDWDQGKICVQQKVYSSTFAVPEDQHGSCESCVRVRRICIQKTSDDRAVVVPLPESLRPGKRREELGYWVQEV